MSSCMPPSHTGCTIIDAADRVIKEQGELSTLFLLLNLDIGFQVAIDFKVLLLVYKSLNGLGHKCNPVGPLDL